MFGLFKHANRWGITELKADLLLNWLRTSPPNASPPPRGDPLATAPPSKQEDKLLYDAIKTMLKGVYLDSYNTFNAAGRKAASDLFESADSSLDDIEKFLRSELGNSYDKRVQRALAKWKRDYSDYDKQFGAQSRQLIKDHFKGG